MRIVAGKYRGRHFEVPRTFKARPTTDFAKENLFNVLRGYINFEDDAPRALDLFAGTGSITLELLSRGCSQVTSVELDSAHVAMIHQFLAALKDTNARVLRADVLRFLKKVPSTYDFIFADPPYALPQLGELPNLIFNDANLNAKPSMSPLSHKGIFVLEHGKDHDFSNHPRLVDHRTYGSVHFSIFQAE